MSLWNRVSTTKLDHFIIIRSLQGLLLQNQRIVTKRSDNGIQDDNKPVRMFLSVVTYFGLY